MDNPLIIHILLFVIMIIIYKFFPGGFENHFTRSDGVKTPPTLVDVVYYVSTTHSTTGFGDIIPKTQIAKITTSVHMMLVFIIIITGLSFGLGQLVKFIHKHT